MKKKFVIMLLILSISFVRCTHNSGKISIVSIKILDYTDTSRSDKIDKGDYFLVLNFSDNKKNEEYLDSFVLKNKDASFEKYANYSMIFYKHSSVTNIENIEANRKIIDRYSRDNDLIYSYEWLNGKFLNKFKFKNGRIITSKIKNITIEDVPRKN